ncbi:MAG TPA: hypothetical protein VLV83_15580 [Acidobacteriota bacterium]|nr:hypothetical protein [Acidobacteriota bacterium]
MKEKSTQPPQPGILEHLDALAEAEGFWEADLHYRPESAYRTLCLNGAAVLDPFTGSTEVRKGRYPVLRPFAAAPPQVSPAQALDKIKRHLRWKLLAPGRIRRGCRNGSNLRGVLLPFWTFDFTAVARYPAQSDSPGGRLQKHFSDIVVPASQALSRQEFDFLQALPLDQVQPFRKSHFRHFYQEHYSKDWKEAFQEAARSAERKLESEHALAANVSVPPESLRMSYQDVAFKLLLLPVWIVAFPYGEDHWRALVDAQSGRLLTDVPRSPLRIAACAAILLALLLWLLI